MWLLGNALVRLLALVDETFQGYRTSVPDLGFDGFRVDGYAPCGKLDANGGFWLHAVLSELGMPFGEYRFTWTHFEWIDSIDSISLRNHVSPSSSKKSKWRGNNVPTPESPIRTTRTKHAHQHNPPWELKGSRVFSPLNKKSYSSSRDILPDDTCLTEERKGDNNRTRTQVDRTDLKSGRVRIRESREMGECLVSSLPLADGWVIRSLLCVLKNTRKPRECKPG